MRFRSKYYLVILILGAMVLSGCTSIIQPRVGQAEFLTAEAKRDGEVVVYITNKFQSYSPRKVDLADCRKWIINLGPVSIDTFDYSLGSKFEKVDVRIGVPSFPVESESGNNVVIVVEPAFDAFGARCPILFKFETYVVYVSFKVNVYSKTGELIIDDKVYEGVGKKRGSIGFGSAGYEALDYAAREAVKNAVTKVVKDILSKV